MTCNFSFWLISSWMEGKARQLKSTGISELLWIKMVFCVLNASRPQDVGGLMGVGGCNLFDTSKVEQETTKIQLKVLWRYLPTATGWPLQFVRLNTKRLKERFFLWTRHGKFSEINIWIVWTANTWCFSRLCSRKIQSSLHAFWTFQVLSVLISNSCTLHR